MLFKKGDYGIVNNFFYVGKPSLFTYSRKNHLYVISYLSTNVRELRSKDLTEYYFTLLETTGKKVTNIFVPDFHEILKTQVIHPKFVDKFKIFLKELIEIQVGSIPDTLKDTPVAAAKAIHDLSSIIKPEVSEIAGAAAPNEGNSFIRVKYIPLE